ncbi:prephenate dehydratase [Dehalobacterium formicoaceticum]|uniref:Prephenate dehydratase n=1 Tax=Dehalobacterium formicoaceticum TaxID=51515 RepID=A0ABT1Y444_9FIRM|nr:prephenate dehydratase [Dehalobacterium formicoaceticum]MCR6544436.1 prephenate dehydratase [Dehalobacterium formicoaceticum]
MKERNVGFLGPKGTYTEAAAQQVFPGQNLIPYRDVTAILTAVSAGEIHHGILPIENLLEGTVLPVLDGLTSFPELKIQGETLIRIEHHLLVKPGMKKEELTAVFSHTQALAQCRNYLREELPHLPCQAMSSTAEAARRVAFDLHTCGAIGNRKAAEIYGLEVLDDNISDAPENTTRFIVIGLEIPPPTGKDKTSLVLSLEHQPGSLSQLLILFAREGINLTKIESRPSRKVMGEYIFYLDFEGHITDERIQKVIKEAENYVTSLSIMGSYPRAGS